MLVGNYPPILIEAAALHSILFNAGFTARELSVVLDEEGNIGVQLIVDGKVCLFHIGVSELLEEETAQKWEELSLEWNKIMTDEDIEKLVRSSLVWDCQEIFKNTLIRSGFPSRWLPWRADPCLN